MTNLAKVASSLDYADIRALLPHRCPRLLVDRVARCEPGMMIETVKAVSSAEPCYANLPDIVPADAYHYPEALLLDSFTQSAALLWARTIGRPFAGMPVLAGTRGVTFHHPVGPGSVVRTVVKLIPGTESTMFFCGRSLVDDQPVLTVGNLVLAIRRPGAVLRAAGE
ncbi:MAG TPA: beta-hydroxyacyl-ACP dehydratase [Pseudonocardiaceae bacterium]|nr:beta-hydroxyacyl-ACP dehydratase [Pseudonocardiaceae bacterium]